jgi:hypothetical protein
MTDHKKKKKSMHNIIYILKIFENLGLKFIPLTPVISTLFYFYFYYLILFYQYEIPSLSLKISVACGSSKIMTLKYLKELKKKIDSENTL